MKLIAKIFKWIDKNQFIFFLSLNLILSFLFSFGFNNFNLVSSIPLGRFEFIFGFGLLGILIGSFLYSNYSILKKKKSYLIFYSLLLILSSIAIILSLGLQGYYNSAPSSNLYPLFIIGIAGTGISFICSIASLLGIFESFFGILIEEFKSLNP